MSFAISAISCLKIIPSIITILKERGECFKISTFIINMQTFFQYLKWGNSLVWNCVTKIYISAKKKSYNLMSFHINITFSLSVKIAKSFLSLFFRLAHQLCSFVSEPSLPTSFLIWMLFNLVILLRPLICACENMYVLFPSETNQLHCIFLHTFQFFAKI